MQQNTLFSHKSPLFGGMKIADTNGDKYEIMKFRWNYQPETFLNTPDRLNIAEKK